MIVLASGGGEEVAVSSGGLGLGAVALIFAIVLLLVWMAYLFVNSRRSRAASMEEVPSNFSTDISDDELENRKLTRVLRAALLGSVLMAIIMPWYAYNEPERQIAFEEETLAHDIEEGARWYSSDGWECADCHGPAGGGGASTAIEERSGVNVSWVAPSLDDVFLRYDEGEVRHWIVFGRDGTPMPEAGLEGGGAMTVQEVDQVMEFLRSIQITQEESFAKAQGVIERALTQIEGGQAATEKQIALKEIEIEEVSAAPAKFDVVGSYPDDIRELLAGESTCTEVSAEIVNTTCELEGADTDRDGISDKAEKGLTAIAGGAHELLTVISYVDAETGYVFIEQKVYDVRFDPFEAFTNGDADLDKVETLLSNIDTDVLLLSVVVERQEQFFEKYEAGLSYLLDALEKRLWEIDFDAVASDMGVSLDDAEQAVGLFNGYCARCHNAGFSSGATFDQGSGTGAWGPSLINGRSILQFPEIADQVTFVSGGSEDGERFGVNGLGSGRMPGFGSVLSERQIELIVMYERTL